MGQDYFDTKNKLFFDFLEDTFNIKKSKNWDDISKNISYLKIKRTYRTFAELFPRKIDYMTELETLKDDFSSIHYGTLKGSRILDEVTRFSLYSDKIVVFHPLQNPCITNPDINPGKNPKYWLPDFMDALYFYIVIQKWVNAGIVKLIVNPYSYDLTLRSIIDQRASERLNALNKDEIFNLSKPETLKNIADAFTEGFKNNTKEEIYNHLLAMKQPTFSPLDAEELSDMIYSQIPFRNPLYHKLQLPQEGGVIVPTKTGGPVESLLLIAEKTGASIYTPSAMNWSQIQHVGVNDFWTKANHLYSKIPLNFLNNVDTTFALEIRKDDRLAGVRKQLKRIYAELNSTKSEDITESRMRDLHDSFIEEVKTAEAEWKEIKRQAEINRKHWLISSAAASNFVAVNEMSIWPMIAGSALWLYKNEASKLEKQKLQRSKNAISVFVDLKNQRQHFFSQLKNCII